MARRTIKKDQLFKKLGTFISVRNTEGRSGGYNAPNQFELVFKNGRVFQSYDSFIAAWVNGELYLSIDHDYSNTTSGHTTRWTGYSTKERREGLESGKFIFVKD